MSWSAEDWAKWFGYIEEQLDDIASMLLLAYPDRTKEHLRTRWAVIRVRMFLNRLRLALSTAPLRPREHR